MRASSLLLSALLVLGLLAGCVEGPDGDDDGDSPDPTEGPDQTPTDVVWGDVASATIRPGASLGGYCTFNFLFQDAAGHAFIGTAGHCTDDIGDRVTLGADGPEIGIVLFDSDVTPGADSGVDFSLILLDADQVMNAHPTMLGYDAPTGVIEAGEASPGDQVALYGYGILLGDQEQTRARFGVLVDEDGKNYRADMPAVNGDSGSPLIHVDTGKAFGIISRYGFEAVPPSTDEGPIMPYILDELTKAGLVVQVATV